MIQRNPLFHSLEQAVADTSARYVLDKVVTHCRENRPVLNRDSNLHDVGVCYGYDRVVELIEHLSRQST